MWHSKPIDSDNSIRFIWKINSKSNHVLQKLIRNFFFFCTKFHHFALYKHTKNGVHQIDKYNHLKEFIMKIHLWVILFYCGLNSSVLLATSSKPTTMDEVNKFQIKLSPLIYLFLSEKVLFNKHCLVNSTHDYWYEDQSRSQIKIIELFFQRHRCVKNWPSQI